MALTNNEKQNSGNLLVLKPVDRDAEKHDLAKPYFSVKKKVDGKWIEDPETYTNVYGTLSKIELEHSEYQGDVSKSAKVYIKDAEDTYLLDFRYNIATRGLFNGLLALKEYNDLKISIYRNKANYLTYYLRQGENSVGWAFSKEQIPAPVKVRFQGKDRTDFSELDEFFEQKLIELSKALGGSGEIIQRASKKEESPKAKTSKKPNPKVEEPTEDQVPF